jgi:hypothetical protein
MRSSYARCVAGTILLASLASTALAQEAGMPSLLPLPPVSGHYPVTQTAATDALWYQDALSPTIDPLPSPSDVLPNSPPLPGKSVISPDYHEAMHGGYGGCNACGKSGCGSYLFANALLMTHDKRGGFVTSVDSGTFEPEVFFCSPEFGRIWHGGFEVGGGWCFGCDCNSALEASYWGLYAAPIEAYASGTLDSTIDFSDIDYNGGSADLFFDGAQAQQVEYDFDFHSVEINIVGNGCCGGPFGCGICGCNCNRGSRWGFGYLAGFRYINFTEDWLFTTDQSDTIIDNSADELNYEVDLDNNLIGFQLGGGINYCVTDRFQTYAIARFGVYGNHIEHFQRIYGPAGAATVNNGTFNGQEYVIDAEDTDLAFVGQMDIGGRWALSQSWSVNFGYRLVGLTGVAIAEDNVAQGEFQNVLGISDTQTQGAFLMHGGYVGATYCF